MTGANGYIGSHVVKALLDMNVDVVVAVRKSENIDKRATIIEGDIFDIKENENLYEKYLKPDVCLHMAWKDGFVHNSDSHMQYLSAHYNFLNNLIEHGLPQVAIIGTVHEIGFYEGMVDENTKTNPLSLYAVAKNALRTAIELKCSQKKVVYQWLRCFYITGDDLKANSIFAKILRAEREGKKTFPFTTGQNKHDFIDVDDLAQLISMTVVQNEVTGIINCCSGIPITLSQKVESFIKENNLNIKLEYGAFPDRPYDSKIIYGNTDKINLIKTNYENKKIV